MARRLHYRPYVNSLKRLVQQLYQRWAAARSRRPELVLSLTYATLGLAAFALGFTLWSGVTLMRGLPDLDAVRHIGEMDQATTVFDSDNHLAFTIYKEQRLEVSLDQVSPALVQAVLAIEDQRFYSHHGFNAIRIASAAIANLRHRRLAQGGSTITQQLARLSFLTPDKTFRRKVQELILACRIELVYSKNEILELYLNKVYFGDGHYGIEAASQGYFGKPARDLTLPEAALLAGLVKSPTAYAPTARQDRALARRNVVLQVMRDQGTIDRTTWQVARNTPIQLHDELPGEDGTTGLYFREQLRQELVDRFGWQRVYQGGLRVYSTIDMRLQQAAETSVANGLKALDKRRAQVYAGKKGETASAGAPLQAALVALDPHTGEVRAMVGGRDFNASRFNRAVQAKRQPGSAFKPFVYAAALEAGFTPATVLNDLDAPITTLQGQWSPEDEHSTGDSMSLRTALRTSSNRAAVQLLQKVGISRTVQYAKTMGVGDLPSVPSLALGSGEVTLQSLTAAYAAFANKGAVPRPQMIRRVEDREGHVLFDAQPQTRQAISESTAFLMSSMLGDVINAGTAAKARTLGFTLPAAGKTGTTNDFNDAWFVGYTPSLVAGVWVGFDQPHTILPNGFASDVAVPVWATFMKDATKDDKPTWLATPPGIVTANVCRITGQLAIDGCQHVDVMDRDGMIANRSMVYTEYFVRGTEPTAYCTLHQAPSLVDTIAAVFTHHDKPAPAAVEDAPLAPPSAPAAVAMSTAAESMSAAHDAGVPAVAKRGFWSKVFGGRRPREEQAPRQ